MVKKQNLFATKNEKKHLYYKICNKSVYKIVKNVYPTCILM